MKTGEIIHLAKAITTRSNGLLASYKLEPRANVTVLVLGITPDGLPTPEQVQRWLAEVATQAAAGKSP
jgi:hypothetical protein